MALLPGAASGRGGAAAPPRLPWGSFGGVLGSREHWGCPPRLCRSALTPQTLPPPPNPEPRGAPGLQQSGGVPQRALALHICAPPLLPPPLPPLPPRTAVGLGSPRGPPGRSVTWEQLWRTELTAAGAKSPPPPRRPPCIRWRKGGVLNLRVSFGRAAPLPLGGSGPPTLMCGAAVTALWGPHAGMGRAAAYGVTAAVLG